MIVSTLSSSVPNCTTRIQSPLRTAVRAIHQPSSRCRARGALAGQRLPDRVEHEAAVDDAPDAEGGSRGGEVGGIRVEGAAEGLLDGRPTGRAAADERRDDHEDDGRDDRHLPADVPSVGPVRPGVSRVVDSFVIVRPFARGQRHSFPTLAAVIPSGAPPHAPGLLTRFASGAPPHGARMTTPSPSSAARTARAMATASGESPCTQSDAASARRACRRRPPRHPRARAERARGDLCRVVQQRARLAARHERAVGEVRRGRGTPRARSGSPAAARGTLDLAAQTEHRHRRARAGRRGRRSPRRPRRACTGRPRSVVQRSVRLDVAHVGARLREGGQLRGDGRRELRRFAVRRAARSSARRVATDARRPRLRSRAARSTARAHRRGIPRVNAAGDARARDHREHRLVVGRRHAAPVSPRSAFRSIDDTPRLRLPRACPHASPAAGASVTTG